MTSDQLAALPSDAVLVHIGPHKTGTTSIQSILANSRPRLRDLGVSYPGKYLAHHREAMALRQFRQGTDQGAPPPPKPAVWTRFALRIGETPGRIVISSELFAQADDRARARLVRDLGPDRVHILAGARNPAGIAVSTWQQDLRTYARPISLTEWLEQHFRRTEPGGAPDEFRGYADPAALVARWAEVVPPEQITVLVVDERDRRRLPTIFEQLLGLPAGLLADQEPSLENRGLTTVEAALVRQIILALDARLSWSEYARTMRAGVIRRLQEVRRPGPEEARAQLPQWAVDQAAAESERSIAALRASGVRIVGDLAALRRGPEAGGDEPEIREVPIELAAEAVVGAIAVATRDSWSLDAPRRRVRRRPRRTP